MSEETDSREPAKIVHDRIGRTTGDLLYSVRWYFVFALLIIFFVVLYLYFRDVVNVAAVIAGFIASGGITYLVFPGAPYSWYLYINLRKKVIAPIPIPVQDAQRLIDESESLQVFTSGTGTAVLVGTPSLAISDIHMISDVHLIASVKAVEKAIAEITPMAEDYQVLKSYRGIDVAQLTIGTLETILASKGLSHLTDQIRGVLDELGEQTVQTSEIRKSTD